VAKLAQDGSQEARQHSRAALAALAAASPVAWERAARRHLTQNTARNLEKIVEAATKSGGGGGGLARRAIASTGPPRRRANNSRMTL